MIGAVSLGKHDGTPGASRREIDADLAETRVTQRSAPFVTPPTRSVGSGSHTSDPGWRRYLGVSDDDQVNVVVYCPDCLEELLRAE